MNIISTIKRSFSVLAVSVLMLSMAGLGSAQATSNGPSFNSGTFNHSTLGSTSERNFLRIGSNGQDGDTANICRNGAQVKVWFYVHNHVSSNFNGSDLDGSGVATGTTVRLKTAPGKYYNGHRLTGYIDSNQTSPISDSVTIQCGSKRIALDLVRYTARRVGSSSDDKSSWGPYKLWSSPVNNNASLGFEGGKVPGCWEYRALMVFTFQVRVAPTNTTPPVVTPPIVPTLPVEPTPPTTTPPTNPGNIDVDNGDSENNLDNRNRNHIDNNNESNNDNNNSNHNNNVNNVHVNVVVNNQGNDRDGGNSGGGQKPVQKPGDNSKKPKNLPNTGVNLTFAFLAIVVGASLAHRHLKLRMAKR